MRIPPYVCVYTGQYLYNMETPAEIFHCIKLKHHTNTSGPCPSPPLTASSSSLYRLSERSTICWIPLLLLLMQLSVKCALLQHLKWAMPLSILIKSSNSKKIWKWTTWRELTRERERERERRGGEADRSVSPLLSTYSISEYLLDP